MGEEKKPQPLKLGDAVAQGIIANQTLAYFIGRTWLFFKRVRLQGAGRRGLAAGARAAGAAEGWLAGWGCWG
jgi:glycyl-tRNA synthetase (class II)